MRSASRTAAEREGCCVQDDPDASRRGAAAFAGRGDERRGGEVVNAPAALSQIARLRARDGDACWLCGRTMDFEAPPGSRKAPSREHLLARSLGGRSTLDNLVLCHPGCNRQLGTRAVEDKRRMRAKRLAGDARRQDAAATAKPAPKRTLPAETHHPAKPPSAPAPSRTAALEPALPPLVLTLRQWQVLALTSTAAALLLLGVSLGMLLAD